MSRLRLVGRAPRVPYLVLGLCFRLIAIASRVPSYVQSRIFVCTTSMPPMYSLCIEFGGP